jgi:hypothetical protein
MQKSTLATSTESSGQGANPTKTGNHPRPKAHADSRKYVAASPTDCNSTSRDLASTKTDADSIQQDMDSSPKDDDSSPKDAASSAFNRQMASKNERLGSLSRLFS